ncbi:PREDICTED: zonadhesin-like, partial [Rhinopithecus bieti]|uniref:zonadhesin-like n=1 Tax=Rhinopithecus bieti TaxID=61621 RepID=UPI00083BE412
MLLDPKNARPGQKAVLLSPVSPSSGCLSFSFHYVLRGQSPGAALHVYASVLGSIRKHTLFSGQPGPNWQAVSVNYTAVGRIQFTVVGVFGKTPEPAVAVDATSIAPCGEGFPQCDFEDNAHPFCDWVQTSGDGGHWALGHKNGPIHGMGPMGGFPNAEKPTISTEKLTIPTEKPTIPTEKLTALRPPHPSPTATGLAALVMSPHAPTAPMTSVILDTTTPPRPNT